MRALLQKETVIETRKYELSSETAREFLNYVGITTKMWMDELGVGERSVQIWKAGLIQVPVARREEIYKKFLKITTQQTQQIDEMIQRALKEQFGPNVDPGRF